MRTIWNLNKNWLFALDKGMNAKREGFGEHLEYEAVTLPHDWAITQPFDRKMKQGEAQGYRDRWGIGWYQRTLTVEKEADKVYRLVFDGVYENSTVWINGEEAGGCKYGYSSFALDITKLLKDGENKILVRVDNTKAPVERWYAGAGIYRKVTLECLSAEHLEEMNIYTETAFTGEKEAVLTIHTGTALPVKASLAVGEHFFTGQSAVSGNTLSGSGEGVIVLPVSGFERWCAENPKLYELKLQLIGTDGAEEETACAGEGAAVEAGSKPRKDTAEGAVSDEVTFRIGFRSVELSADKGLLVNGVSTKLQGVCVHQDAGCFGTAVTKEVWRERLAELKKIGCNALRLAHHLYMPEMLELCDELGFYVYEEAFDKWTGGAYGRYYETEWKKDLTCMVERDRNHPSILFWGVGNEVENQSYPSMLKLLESHVQAVKACDSTRPVSLAMNPHFAYPTEEVDMSTVEDIQQFVDEMKSGEIFDMDDRVTQITKIAEKVDFICCNYMEQWYHRIHKAIPDKVILGTETYMNFRGFAEKFQNFTEQNPWHDVMENDYVIGGFIWTGIDYLGESMGYPAKGWSGALFADDMEKRPMAWQLQSYWKKEPMVHFAVMDYSLPDEGVKEHWDAPRYVSHWEFPQFTKTVIPYRIATTCEEAEIHINEKEYSVPGVNTFSNRVITGFLPYFPGEITIIGKNDGKEVCRHTLKTPDTAVKLAFEREEQTVRLERCLADGGKADVQPYLLLNKVRAYDAEGNPVFRESAKVSFVVEGPAELIGVENGDIKSAEPVDNDFVHLFRGRADAAVRITGAGRVKITAYAAGMSPAQTVIAAE